MNNGRIGDGLRAWGRRWISRAPTARHEAAADWRKRFRDGGAAAIEAHPRLGDIPVDFTIGGYLARNPDVMDATDSAEEALFHYLEFGMAEGRSARTERWCADFVSAYHGIELPPDLLPEDAHDHLRAQGVALADRLLSGVDFWLSLGLHGPALDPIFDHEVYAVLADAAGHPVTSRDRLSCIRHAAATGLSAGVALHPMHAVDPDFYSDMLRLRGLPSPNGGLPLHWARNGLRGGAHANARSFVWFETGLTIPESVVVALSDIRRHMPMLSGAASDAETLAAVLSTPARAAAVMPLDDGETRDFLRGLAMHRLSRRDRHGAEGVLDLLHRAAPEDALVAADLAPLKRRSGQRQVEHALREVAAQGSQDPAAAVELAALLRRDGDIKGAVAVLTPFASHAMSDSVVQHRFKKLAVNLFRDVWDTLDDHIAALGVADVQALLTRILRVATPPTDLVRRPRPIARIAILSNADLPQCKHYRVDQKVEQLRMAGVSVQVFDHAAELGLLDAQLDRFDALILARVPGFPEVAALLVKARAIGVVTFYDVDDLIFDAGVFPPDLKSYAGSIMERQWNAIACGVPLFAHAMALCDIGIASTPALRDAMAPYMASGRAILHRHGWDESHARAVRAAVDQSTENGKVLLFYGSGTKAHKAAFHDILEPALARVLAARSGRITVRLMGQFGAFRHLDPRHPDVEVLAPIADFEAYADILSTADIALAVLESSPVADAKSEIKWIEAALFGIPSVLSDTRPYRDVVVDDETGFLCRDTESWVDRLTVLIDDPALRGRIGTAARAKVLRDYAPDAQGSSLVDALNGVAAPVGPRKTRLLLVNVYFPPRDTGGATHVVRDNVRDLLDRFGGSYEIDVIATRPDDARPYSVACAAWNGARVWTIGVPGTTHAMALHDATMGDVFDRLLDRIGPNLVHFHCLQHLTLSVVDSARRRAMPYVITLHDGWWSSARQFITSDYSGTDIYDYRPEAAARRPDRARALYPRLKDAAAVLAVSESFADLHRAAGLPFVRACENGLPNHEFPQRRPNTSGRVRIGHVGGAAQHKGVGLLRAAVESTRLHHIDLSVIHHGIAPGTKRTEMWNGTPVTLCPRVSQDEMAAHYANLDVLVAPSVWPEPYGLVTREAAAAGLWVVASDRGAIGDGVIEGKTGHIVPVDTPEPLAACLKRIDEAPERYTASPAVRPMIRPSRDQAGELHELYLEVLGERTR